MPAPTTFPATEPGFVPARPRRPRKRVRRIARAALGVLILAIAIVTIDSWKTLGRSPAGERLARLERSAHYRGGEVVNDLPRHDRYWAALKRWLAGGSSHRVPAGPVPVVPRTAQDYASPPPSGLRLTWLGHSTVLVELDGHRLITDPHWSHRNSPTRWVGPLRFFAPPLSLDALPPLDAALISHDHLDHLDLAAVRALDARRVPFIVPLGVGAHLEYWGVPAERITELDWWEHTAIGSLELHCTPARHFSGRALWDTNATLWAGWAMVGPEHRVYYSGDTAMFPGFAEIGERLGPFDLTLLDAGQYDQTWADVHLGPEQAVAAHQALRGRLLLPVHWATFNLAAHGWTEPAERTLVEATKAGVHVVIPKPGELVDPMAPSPPVRWWPDVPWQTAEQNPVVSSGL